MNDKKPITCSRCGSIDYEIVENLREKYIHCLRCEHRMDIIRPTIENTCSFLWDKKDNEF